MKLQKLILPSLIGLSLITVVVVWRSTEPELSEVERSHGELSDSKLPNKESDGKFPKGSLSLSPLQLPSQLPPSANPDQTNSSTPNIKTKGVNLSHLSPMVLNIIDKNPKTSFSDRLKAAQSLEKPTSEEREALYAWMLRANQEKVGEMAENAIRNDLLSSLIQTGEDGPRLQELMVRILEDTSADLVWRDYMLQHMPIFEAKHLGENSPSPQASKTKGVDENIFLELSQKYAKDLSLSGTALIAWERLLNQSTQPKTELIESAWATASSKDFTSASRTTALQILANHKDPRALSLAKNFLKNPSSFTLNLSAISVLGRLGTEEDLNLLAQLPNKPHLNRVTQKAVQNIKERHKI